MIRGLGFTAGGSSVEDPRGRVFFVGDFVRLNGRIWRINQFLIEHRGLAEKPLGCLTREGEAITEYVWYFERPSPLEWLAGAAE